MTTEVPDSDEGVPDSDGRGFLTVARTLTVMGGGTLAVTGRAASRSHLQHPYSRGLCSSTAQAQQLTSLMHKLGG